MEMTLEKLLSTYWSQLTLVIFAIGYFIQKIYELKLKKEETRHSLFQQNKINTIMKFLSCYAKVEQIWQHIPHSKIIQNRYTAMEIDEMIWPLMNDLQGTRNELTIFLIEKELLLFDNIINSILKLNDKLSAFVFNPKEGENIILMSNEFHQLRSESFKENKKMLSEIGELSRKMFNS